MPYSGTNQSVRRWVNRGKQPSNNIREEDLHVAFLEELEKRGWKLEEKRCCQKYKKEEMHRAANSNMQEEVKWTFKN